MKRLLVALQFLTIFPIKVKQKVYDKDFGRSLLYFPLVGLLIGALLSLVILLFPFLPRPVSAAFILILSAIVTGGMHLDGFADTCDAISSGKDREKMLEIMRDSRIGAIGAVGLILLFLLKFSALASIRQDGLWRALIMTMTFSRWSQVLACNGSTYARETGKAKFFIEHVDRREAVIGGLFTLAIFFLSARLNGLMLFIASLLIIYGCINFLKKRIGGMTGDAIGATSEIAEACVLVLSLFYLK